MASGRIPFVAFALSLAACVAPAAARAQNLVEPLSNGLRLSWTKPEIVAKFGAPTKPSWDDRTFGYDGFGFQVGGRRLEIWRMFIDQPGITLASGIGVGSSTSDVTRVFGQSGQITSGQYKLTFAYDGGAVSRIKIEPANESFAPVAAAAARRGDGNQSDAPPRAAKSGIPPEQVVGTWYGSNVAGQIDIHRNGSYTSPNGARGRWRVQGNQIVFTGPLASWNKGHATFTNGNIEFYWTTAEGAKQYFAFIRR